MYNLKYPYVLLLIPIVTYLFFMKSSKNSIKIPGIQIIKKYKNASKKHLLGRIFMWLSSIFMLLALARPQLTSEGKLIKKDGIDIVVALDLSKSMLQNDFRPNRLEKSKEILTKFIDKRISDRMSLIVFAGEAYAKVPLTFDHNVLKDVIYPLTVEDITTNNRTAIGMGLGVAINRLKKSESKTKVIILMTDGENNSGEMNPISAAKLAKELGIKIYTVGIGGTHIPVENFFGTSYVKNTELDENLLYEIANETGGKYFRASDSESFENIFKTIDSLEKSKIETKSIYDIKEYYESLILISLIFLLLGVFFEYFKYIKIP